MAIKFPSEEWLKALMEEINKSEAYRDAAKTWEGDFYFVIEPEGALKEKVVAYVDLWHGECRTAFIVADETMKKPEFSLRAPLSVWRKVLEKKLDPIKGIMTGQLKLQGNFLKIMKSTKAALELVNCTTRIPTQFPK